jgi:hypothetical protein
MFTKSSRPLIVLFLVVLANYLSQIPYNLHLYGLNVNPRGAGLLGLTLVWFLIGFWLLVWKKPIGYWLTMAFLAVQFLFYFNNEIVRMFDGYGLLYHLTDFHDPVIWPVFLMGDVNFFAAAFFLYYLARNKSAVLSGTWSA